MKQWKKGMAVLLAFAMVMIGLNISPIAAGAEGAPKFFAEAVTAEPGSEIEIPVKIDGNTGIMGLGIAFGFDKRVLTPVDDVKQTNLLVGQFNNSIGTMLEGAQNFDVKWQGTDNMREDGELFTLKFKVADNASGSTKLTLTLLEDDTFNEQYENKAVNCEDIMITIKSAEPSQAPDPTEKPEWTEKPTKEPDDPIWTDEPQGIYLNYASDADYTEWITDGVYAQITGNGEYSVEFTAGQSTKNIQYMRLYPHMKASTLPDGMRIVPVMLIVGNETYPVTQYKDEEQSYGNTVIIRDLSVHFDGGYAQIPVFAGDVVKVTFKIEGIGSGTGDEPTSPPFSTEEPVTPTEQPSAPTNAPGGQTPATAAPNVPGTGTTNAPAVQNPAGETRTSPAVPAFSRPRKVKLQSVKKAGKKKLKVMWKWNREDNGYQIQYAQNRSFTKKKKTVRPYWQYKITLSGLVSKKTYYVRVRAYRYDYNSGRKYYGPWSNVKKCKVK